MGPSLKVDPEVRRLRDEISLLREELRQLRSTLSTGRWLKLRGLSLTRSEQGVVYALLTTRGETTTARVRATMDAMLGQTEGGTEQSVKVAVARLRPKLLALCPPIEIQTIYGFGIWLDEINRARLEERWENRPNATLPER